MNEKDKKALDAEVTKALAGENGEAVIWVLKNWKKVIGIIFAILAVILIITGITSYRDAQTVKGGEAFGAASNPAEIRAALAKFSSHVAADSARIRLAKMLVNEKKYADAVKELAAVAAPAAKLMTGYIYELNKQDKEALAAFNAVLNDLQADSASRAEAKYAAARLYVQGKDVKKAQAVLKMTLPQSAGAQQWEASSKQLLLQIENGDFK